MNSPPVANDDPSSACSNPLQFGGGFPIPEDYRYYPPPAPPPGDWFLFFGNCHLLYNDTDPDGDPLTWEVVTPPAHGQVMKIDDDFWAYKPDPNAASDNGFLFGHTFTLDTFTYHACDASSCSAPATMKIWLAPVNDPPTFTAGPTLVLHHGSGAYSGAWATNVSPGPANESDQTVHFDVQTSANGVPNLFAVAPAISSDGTLTFTPGAGKVGLAHVTVKAVDDGGMEDWQIPHNEIAPDDTSDTVVFDIVVDNTNPVAVTDTPTVLEDSGVNTIDVLANDTDADGDPLTVSGASDGTNGTVVPALDGSDLTYQPAANYAGPDSFPYTIDDGNGGTATGTVNVTVTAVNDAPAGTDKTLPVTSPADIVFTSADFGFTDPSDNPPNALSAVTITTTPADGHLKYNGDDVAALQSIPAADIDAGDLTFTPGNGAHAGSSFTFQVQDDGGTANGGVDLDPSANTMTLDANPAKNKAPTGTDNTVTTIEDTAYTFASTDFGFSDATMPPANALMAVKITTLPSPAP